MEDQQENDQDRLARHLEGLEKQRQALHCAVDSYVNKVLSAGRTCLGKTVDNRQLYMDIEVIVQATLMLLNQKCAEITEAEQKFPQLASLAKDLMESSDSHTTEKVNPVQANKPEVRERKARALARKRQLQVLQELNDDSDETSDAKHMTGKTLRRPRKQKKPIPSLGDTEATAGNTKQDGNEELAAKVEGCSNQGNSLPSSQEGKIPLPVSTSTPWTSKASGDKKYTKKHQGTIPDPNSRYADFMPFTVPKITESMPTEELKLPTSSQGSPTIKEFIPESVSTSTECVQSVQVNDSFPQTPVRARETKPQTQPHITEFMPEMPCPSTTVSEFMPDSAVPYRDFLPHLSPRSVEFMPQTSQRPVEFMPGTSSRPSEYLPQTSPITSTFLPQTSAGTTEFMPQTSPGSTEFMCQTLPRTSDFPSHTSPRVTEFIPDASKCIEFLPRTSVISTESRANTTKVPMSPIPKPPPAPKEHFTGKAVKAFMSGKATSEEPAWEASSVVGELMAQASTTIEELLAETSHSGNESASETVSTVKDFLAGTLATVKELMTGALSTVKEIMNEPSSTTCQPAAESQTTNYNFMPELSTSSTTGESEMSSFSSPASEISCSYSSFMQDTSKINNDPDWPQKENHGSRRKAHPESWKKNVQKTKKLRGEEHISRNGQIIQAKKIHSVDCTKCKLKCTTHYSEERRNFIFKKFYAMASNERQKDFVCHFVEESLPKLSWNEDGSVRNKRQVVRKYYLPFAGGRRQVCMNFFKGTLAIGNMFIAHALANKKDGCYIGIEKRGASSKRLPKTDLDAIRSHIRSFPAVECYDTRDNTTHLYLDQNLNVTKMYRLYLKHCADKNLNPLKLSTYRHVFKTEFNLSFFKP